jgi:hypothetical protein
MDETLSRLERMLAQLLAANADLAQSITQLRGMACAKQDCAHRLEPHSCQHGDTAGQQCCGQCGNHPVAHHPV